jgi:hypothetical protein
MACTGTTLPLLYPFQHAGWIPSSYQKFWDYNNYETGSIATLRKLFQKLDHVLRLWVTHKTKLQSLQMAKKQNMQFTSNFIYFLVCDRRNIRAKGCRPKSWIRTDTSTLHKAQHITVFNSTRRIHFLKPKLSYYSWTHFRKTGKLWANYSSKCTGWGGGSLRGAEDFVREARGETSILMT